MLLVLCGMKTEIMACLLIANAQDRLVSSKIYSKAMKRQKRLLTPNVIPFRFTDKLKEEKDLTSTIF